MPYLQELVERALEAEEPVVRVDHADHSRTYHAAMQYENIVYRVTIDTIDDRDEYDSDPQVTFAKCYPDAELDVLRRWTNVATGRLYGPQHLEVWERLFTAFNAALGSYHDEPDAPEREEVAA